MIKTLGRVRVAVLAVDGFEQVEVTLPVAALKRAGAEVRIVSLRPGRIRGMNFLGRGRTVLVDDLVADARVEDYGALLLPGGFVNPDLLRQSEKACAFVRAFELTGRPIAAICHGPEVLISAGVLPGRRLTSWPGIRDDVRNAGGDWVDQPVVVDRNLVSSRSPLDLRAFVPAMLDLFASAAPRSEAALPRRRRPVAVISQVAGLAAVPLALGFLVKSLAARGKIVAGLRQARRTAWLAPALAIAGMRLAKLVAETRPRLTGAVTKEYQRADHQYAAAAEARRSAEAAPPPA